MKGGWPPTPSLILAALAAFLVLALPASAKGGPEPLSFEPRFGDQGRHIVSPVDYLTWCGDCVDDDYHAGTPWVVNPRTNWPYSLPITSTSGCLWDSDDYFSYVSRGSVLGAGVTTSLTECVYAGPQGSPFRYLGIFVTSSSPDLLVMSTWTWADGSVSTQTPGVFDSSRHLWSYFDCIEMPRVQASLVTIPDSNGGQALPELLTVTVTNTGRKAGKTGGVISSNYSHGEIQTMGCLSFRVLD